MKKVIGIAAVIGGLMLSTTAFAQVTPPTANNVPGIGRYLANPGYQQATDVGAQCGVPGVSGAGSGAFGYFGKDLNMAGGADGTQTGLNNSALCGNRQGNLP
jgi:hypothetical protein